MSDLKIVLSGETVVLNTCPPNSGVGHSDALPQGSLNWIYDPDNPRNWPASKKWITTAVVSFYSFVAPLGGTIVAPGLTDVASKYHITSPTVLALTLSIFLLSFAIGPLFLAPLSEMYGRAWVLHVGNVVFLVFNLACALAPTVQTFVAFRFFAGLAGSTSPAISGGVVSDLFCERDRASPMALYSLGFLIGPVVGPLAGGFIAQTVGIEYVFYATAAICGVASLFAIPFLRETYAPVILSRKDISASDPEKAPAVHSGALQDPRNKCKWKHLITNMLRLAVILTHSFICFILSLYMALVYGIFYLMFATFPDLFVEVYHWDIGSVGLAYIGAGLGSILAALLGGNASNKLYSYLAARNNGQGKPEMRIPILIIGSFFAPVGLFWYGWSGQAQAHWIMPIIGTGIYSLALLATSLPIQLYLVDAFPAGASAIAAASFFRYVLGFVFPLFGEEMYTSFGFGPGNSLLAGLAMVIGIPFSVWIYYAGERIRTKSAFSV